jgi:hypothetical protein
MSGKDPPLPLEVEDHTGIPLIDVKTSPSGPIANLAGVLLEEA